jgi:hypothetical protein
LSSRQPTVLVTGATPIDFGDVMLERDHSRALPQAYDANARRRLRELSERLTGLTA